MFLVPSSSQVLPKDFTPTCPLHRSIPPTLQYIFDSSTQPRPFTFWNYLSLKSALRNFQPNLAILHYPDLPPTGPWFKLAKRHLTLSRISRTDVSGPDDVKKQLSDMFLRVSAMHQNGGLFLSLSTVVLKPLSGLHNRNLFFQTQCEGEYSPDIFLATPRSEYMTRWLKALRGEWYWLGWWVGAPHEAGGPGTLASRITKYIPEEVRVVPTDALEGVEEDKVWDYLDKPGGPEGRLAALVLRNSGEHPKVFARSELVKTVKASKLAMEFIGDEWDEVERLLRTVGMGGVDDAGGSKGARKMVKAED